MSATLSTTAHFKRFRTPTRARTFLHAATHFSAWLKIELRLKDSPSSDSEPSTNQKKKSSAVTTICVHRLLERTRPRTTRTLHTDNTLNSDDIQVIVRSCNNPSAHSRGGSTFGDFAEQGSPTALVVRSCQPCPSSSASSLSTSSSSARRQLPLQ